MGTTSHSDAGGEAGGGGGVDAPGATHWHDRLSVLTKPDPYLPPVVQKLSLGALEHWEPGLVRKVWELEPNLLNPEGFLFGGYYGVLADQVGTFSAMTMLSNDELMRTSSLEVDYFRPVGEGPLTLTGRVTNKSANLLHADVDFMLPDGRLAARARVVFALWKIS